MTEVDTRTRLLAARFPHGDCRDAVLGTMLRAAGMPAPEAVLFAELGFRVERTGESFRNVVITLRRRDAVVDLPAVCGLRVDQRRHHDLGEYLAWVDATTGSGLAAAVTVDHWHYEPSQFHRSGHMPHHVLVADVRDQRYTVVDPYAYSPFDGEVDTDRFRTWVDASDLGDYRYVGFALSDGNVRFDEVGSWLRETWRTTAEHNVDSMLHGSETCGVKAIVSVADRIQEWVDAADFADDVASNRKMPTTSFLETGAVRRGHALWLRRVAALGVPRLAGIADEMHEVGMQWDVVSAVRHAYQVVGADPGFVARKIAQIPRQLRLIADAERVVMEKVAEVVRP